MNSDISERIITSRNGLPSLDSVTFPASPFFQVHHALPTPEEVRAVASAYGPVIWPTCPPPVVFPSLNLIVKYGPRVTISEGQSLLFVRRYLKELVSVPEVFGWCKDRDEVFIYMQLITGPTLLQMWDSITAQHKSALCEELKAIVEALRLLEQDPDDRFIDILSSFTFVLHPSSVGGQPICDNIFQDREVGGTFRSIADFHNWFSTLETIDPNKPHAYRSWLMDDMPVYFTHADIHRGNIIVSATSPPHILAIVDWGQSGWYPSYWEFCKARRTTHYGEEWEAQYIPRFLGDEFEEYCWRWDFFVQRLGV